MARRRLALSALGILKQSDGGVDDLLVYGGLFAAAFVAATLLPAQSEAVLAGLVLAGRPDVVALVLVATAGNVLGSLTNWGLGRLVTTLGDRPWFPVKRSTLAKAEGWYRRFGRWSLLLSWAPVIGDPLTLVAGVLKERLDVFLVLVTIAKLARYVAVAALARAFV